MKFPLSIAKYWDNTQLNLTQSEKEWLLETGSLTAKLKQVYNTVSVEVLNESVLTLPIEVARLLECEPTSALCREVLLYGDNQVKVYAQSWIPIAQLDKSNELLTLGNKPLGEYIFKHPDLLRGEIAVCELDLKSPLAVLLDNLKLPLESCKSRYSVFQLNGVKLFVSETFLPGVIG